MENSSKLIKCANIHIECHKDTDNEPKIEGVNTFSFDFYVFNFEASEVILYTLTKLSVYKFKEISIGLKENVFVNMSSLWTKEAIDSCIDNKLGFLKEDDEDFSLKLKK
jgi:hypothetical protein